VVLCGLDPETLIESSFLPGEPPRDPADRIVLATARAHALPVMTRDRAILAYAEAGHVGAIPC
jgi:PIN domain nuclease of toxin-antitoxin system